MYFNTLRAMLVAAGLLVPVAAMAAPSTFADMSGLHAQPSAQLVRADGNAYSGTNWHNYRGRWGYRDHRYGYGPYYGYRGRPFGYYRYPRPGVSFGLSPYPYPYYHGPSFGIYVNP